VDFSNSLQDLHNRYLLQAKWTAENRHRLYQSAKLHQASQVLEVGSGTSAIIHEITHLGLGTAYGIDIDSKAVLYARTVDPRTRYSVGDGLHLPYRTRTFDVTICHFLLMWVSDPKAILQEMLRVTKVDGAVLALAEPDYGGRIDFPESLEALGRHQADSLKAQGADPQIGRKLRMLFAKAGLENIHIGVLGGEWYGMPDEMSLDSEWRILMSDLEGSLSIEQIDNYQELDRSAWMKGFRVLYVPTFYAIGWHKDS
jgi:ubiquinone/menaquinone biosynthesis C-methylase UbiE